MQKSGVEVDFPAGFFVSLPKKSTMEDILAFLDAVLHNNNRPWFQEHKKQYQQAQAHFNAIKKYMNVDSGGQKTAQPDVNGGAGKTADASDAAAAQQNKI